MAYGVLELKPREFEELQPHELLSLWSGFLARERRRKAALADCIQIGAYYCAHLLNISGKSLKRHINPQDLARPLVSALIGEAEGADSRKEDEEYLRRVFKLPSRK